jgi:uncharacterized membrane protein
VITAIDKRVLAVAHLLSAFAAGLAYLFHVDLFELDVFDRGAGIAIAGIVLVPILPFTISWLYTRNSQCDRPLAVYLFAALLLTSALLVSGLYVGIFGVDIEGPDIVPTILLQTSSYIFVAKALLFRDD